MMHALQLNSVPIRLVHSMEKLVQVADGEKVDALFEKLTLDIQRKITFMRTKEKAALLVASSEVPPDEKIITKLKTQGFSANAATRAVIFTKSESFQAAFAWAIAHNLDPDFDDPIGACVESYNKKHGKVVVVLGECCSS